MLLVYHLWIVGGTRRQCQGNYVTGDAERKTSSTSQFVRKALERKVGDLGDFSAYGTSETNGLGWFKSAIGAIADTARSAGHVSG